MFFCKLFHNLIESNVFYYFCIRNQSFKLEEKIGERFDFVWSEFELKKLEVLAISCRGEVKGE